MNVLAEYALELAALSDVGTEREHNEDACSTYVESASCGLVSVADGISGSAGGEVASQMAVSVLVRAYAEEAPTAPAGQRLYRAVQQANIEIYDRGLAVPELHGMGTTLTAAVVERGDLTAVHVGDSRLYLLRHGTLSQLTRDHTVAAEKVRAGLLTRDRARIHPDRAVLTRCVGRELIVTRDRITQPLQQGDVVLLCSDGVHNVLADAELGRLLAGRDASSACRAVLDAANAKGTADNVTAAVLRVVGATPGRGEPAPARAKGKGARAEQAAPPGKPARPTRPTRPARKARKAKAVVAARPTRARKKKG